MKKILALSLLTLFSFSFIINPANAILESKKEKNEQTILEYLNYDWWKKQNDPYLEKYIATAIKNNHDIKTAALKIEQARLDVTMTRAGQLPSLSIGASPAVGKMPDSTKSMGTFALPVLAQYELDLFGKNWDKTKSSKKRLQGAIYQAQASDIAIISHVGAIYYNIVKLDKIISLQEETLKDREEIFRLMKLANEEGIASTSDLILSEKQYVMAQNDLIDYKKARQNSLNALAVLIGDSPNNINNYERISYDELSGEFDIPNEINSEIITNRPDYKSLEKQLESAGLDVRVAKKEFLPTINILGMLTFLATSSASAMNWENSLALLAGSANLPIFTGFKRTANLKLNKNKYQQLLEQYQKTNLIAMQEVNDTLYNFKSNKEKMLNNNKTLEIQKQDYKYSQSKFNQGVISKLDLLQQKENLTYMEKLATNSKIDCHIEKINLYKVTGAKI